MGCFSASCVITHTAINMGDPVFMICSRDVETENILGRKYKISGAEHAHTYQLLRETFLLINDSGYKDARHPYVASFGEYNDYGWIEDFPRFDNHREGETMFTCLIHKHVVDTILSEHAFEGMDINSGIEVAYVVASFAMLTRIQLFHSNLLGNQHPDEYEREAHSLLIRMMQDTHNSVYGG